MRCLACGTDNPAGQKFCGECGAALAQRCASCGHECPPGNKFCGACGSKLDSGDVLAETKPNRVAAIQQTRPKSFAGDRYTVKRFLGEGGMKQVHLAHDSLLDRDVAISVIKTAELAA